MPLFNYSRYCGETGTQPLLVGVEICIKHFKSTCTKVIYFARKFPPLGIYPMENMQAPKYVHNFHDCVIVSNRKFLKHVLL